MREWGGGKTQSGPQVAFPNRTQAGAFSLVYLSLRWG